MSVFLEAEARAVVLYSSEKGEKMKKIFDIPHEFYTMLLVPCVYSFVRM